MVSEQRVGHPPVQYNTSDGKNAGILLQGDKDNYRAMLVALQGVTGVPVSVGEKERGFIPVGVTTTVAKDTDERTAAKAVEAIGTVSVVTTPDGAEVSVDDQFYGNGPVTLKLKPGKHTITAKMAGYKDWSREISTDSGSEAHLTATLEKNP